MVKKVVCINDDWSMYHPAHILNGTPQIGSTYTVIEEILGFWNYQKVVLYRLQELPAMCIGVLEFNWLADHFTDLPTEEEIAAVEIEAKEFEKQFAEFFKPREIETASFDRIWKKITERI